MLLNGVRPTSHSSKAKPKHSSPLDPAVEAYNKGHYKEAEAIATQIAEQAKGSKDLKIRKHGVQARYILAFSAARRKDMKLASDRFTVLKDEAAKLPDKGAREPSPGYGQSFIRRRWSISACSLHSCNG